MQRIVRLLMLSIVVSATLPFVGTSPVGADVRVPSLWVVDDVLRVTFNVSLSGEVNRSFPTPGGAFSSVEVDPVNGTLWGTNEGSIAAGNPGKLVNYSRAGTTIAEIPVDRFGAFGGEGMAVAVEPGGDSLWVVDDPDTAGRVPTVYNVTRDGTLIGSFPVSMFSTAATSPQAIAYDKYSSSLWITDNTADAVFNVSTSGELLGSFLTDAGPFVTADHPAGVTNVQAVTVESATHLWISGRSTGMVYRVSKAGPVVSQSFPVTVLDPAANGATGLAYDTAVPGPQPLAYRSDLTDIRDELDRAVPGLTGKAADKAVEAVGELDKVLDDDVAWEADGSLSDSEGKRVFDKMKRASEKLLEVDGPPGPIVVALDALVDLSAEIAQAKIDDAVAAGGDPGLIEEADKEMADALEKIAKGELNKAIEEYKKAWEKARDALQG